MDDICGDGDLVLDDKNALVALVIVDLFAATCNDDDDFDDDTTAADDELMMILEWQSVDSISAD